MWWMCVLTGFHCISNMECVFTDHFLSGYAFSYVESVIKNMFGVYILWLHARCNCMPGSRKGSYFRLNWLTQCKLNSTVIYWCLAYFWSHSARFTNEIITRERISIPHIIFREFFIWHTGRNFRIAEIRHILQTSVSRTFTVGFV